MRSFAAGAKVSSKYIHNNTHGTYVLVPVEERQEQNAKRRKLETQTAKVGDSKGPALSSAVPPTAPSVSPIHPSLPQRPVFAVNADSIGFGAPPTAQSIQNIPVAVQALAGSNRDVVANRRAIRMANMSAAEMLKAELSGLAPVKPDLSLPPKPMPISDPMTGRASLLEASQMSVDSHIVSSKVPGLQARSPSQGPKTDTPAEDADVGGEPDSDAHTNGNDPVSQILAGVKRKFDETGDDLVDSAGEDDDDTPVNSSLAMKVNSDGTVEQEDTVKYVIHAKLIEIILNVTSRLWEPGYKERYYRQKFGIELSDSEFRKKFA
jgi:5'-3' exoribonuclease 2